MINYSIRVTFEGILGFKALWRKVGSLKPLWAKKSWSYENATIILLCKD